MGLKFVRSGVDSANLVAVRTKTFMIETPSWTNNPNWDWFAIPLENFIEPAQGVVKLVSKKFSTVTDTIQQVGLSDMATYTADGTKRTPVFPHKIFFETHPSMAGKFSTTIPKNFASQFLEDLQSIPANS